jgi:hypothetical protein
MCQQQNPLRAAYHRGEGKHWAPRFGLHLDLPQIELYNYLRQSARSSPAQLGDAFSKQPNSCDDESVNDESSPMGGTEGACASQKMGASGCLSGLSSLDFAQLKIRAL